MKSRTPIELGDLGESVLENWCAQVGIVHNKAKRDRTGWDHYLEFPYDDLGVIKIPLDKQKDPIRCWVQVKSTDTRPGKISVKLSNWDRLIKKSEPSFFLILEFDGEREPQNAYLVHVYKDLITKVLKRQRKLGSKSKAHQYKHNLQLRYGGEHKLNFCNGIELMYAIKRYTGDDINEYVVNKLKILGETGYERGNREFEFKAMINKEDIKKEPQEILVDFVLGITPDLKMEEARIYESRFGIRGEYPVNELIKGGKISIHNRKPDGYGKIIFTNSSSLEVLSIDTDVYVPIGIGFELDEKYLKLRFKAPFIEFILLAKKEENVNFRIEYPIDKCTYVLKDLVLFSKIITFLNTATKMNSSLSVDVVFNNKAIAAGKVNSGFVFDATLLNMVNVIESLNDIVKLVDLTNNIKINYDWLHENMNTIESYKRIIYDANVRMKVMVSLEEKITDLSNDKCVSLILKIPIDKYIIFIGLSLIGRAELVDPEKLIFEVVNSNRVNVEVKNVYDMLVVNDHIQERIHEYINQKYKDKFDVIVCDK